MSDKWRGAWNRLLFLLLSAGFLLRAALLPLRWINPDEGAHLLDARLLLAGFWPVAEYSSRQPFYVAVLALFVKIGGMHLWVGRLLPALASTATAFVLYQLGKKLYDARVGLTAAAVWLFLPLIVIWATVVKTEPLTILLGCLSMLLVAKAFQENRSALLLSAGIFAALAFYVRQPALYLPLTAAIFLLLSKNSLKNLLLYFSGYTSVVLAFFLIFGKRMAFETMLVSQLNPATLIFSRLFHLLGKAPEALRLADDGGFRILDQSIDYTLLAWKQALAFAAVILFPAWGAIWRRLETSDKKLRLLIILWPSVILAMYLFQSVHRGFDSQYLTEALPPLTLAAAAFISEMTQSVKKQLTTLLIIGCFGIILVLAKLNAGLLAPAPVQLIGSVILAVVSTWLFDDKIPALKEAVHRLVVPVLIPASIFLIGAVTSLHWFFRFIGAYLFLMAYYSVIQRDSLSLRHLFWIGFFITAFSSGTVLGPRYESVWSTTTLKNCAATLRREGEPTDSVLSGAGIWTFEAGMLPFLNAPHPTEFQLKRRTDFENQFSAQPPQFIIVDGYTERKFGKYWEFIQEKLSIEYEKVEEIGASKYPVVIFRHKGSREPLPSLMGEKRP